MTEQVRTLIIEITKLSLKPGETLAVRVPPDSPPQQIESIAKDALRIVPPGVQVVIIPKDIELTIIAPWEG